MMVFPDFLGVVGQTHTVKSPAADICSNVNGEEMSALSL
jgi:hypothetical protein